jgi:hypothetical protein
MKNKSFLIKVLVIAAFAILVPTVVISVRNASATSEIDFKKPSLITNYSSSGDAAAIETLKTRTVKLLEMKAVIFNGGVYSTSEEGFQGIAEWAIDSDSNVVALEHLWSKRNLTERSKKLKAIWKLAEADRYTIPIKATYQVDSWQGVRIADDGKSATVVVTGRIFFKYWANSNLDVLDQSQIKLVNENGVWLLDEVVAVNIDGY